jgi:hypothetical protein
MSTSSKANKRLAPDNAADDQQPRGSDLEARLDKTTKERDDAVLRAEHAEQQLKDLTKEMAKMKDDASFKAQLSRAKAAAVEVSDLQTRLKEAIARAEGAETIADILRQKKESAEGMVETTVEEHSALVEERNQLEKENIELKTQVSRLRTKKSVELLSVPDSDAADEEVDRAEAAASSSHRGGKRRRSEATRAHRADPSHIAKTTASASRRRRRSSPALPPQESQSDFEFDLSSGRDEARRLNFTAQPNARSAWRSVGEQTEDEDSEIEIAVSSSRKNGKRRGFAATETDRLDHSRNAKATASAIRRRRRPSPTPSPQENQSDSELELPLDIDEVRRPGFMAQPIPRPVWRVVRGQMVIWDQKRPEWRVQEEKLVCASSYTRKRSSEFSDGPDHACSHCKKHGNVCVVVCGGRIRLLPVKGAEAMGEESEGYWKAAVPERKA